MIRVSYNVNKEELKDRYLQIFDIPALEKGWKQYEHIFNIGIKDLLTSNFDKLVEVYFLYKNSQLSNPEKAYINELFNYEHYQPKLAWFFMNPQNKFDFKTCHYCNMSYVNAYGLGDSYKTVLDFVNNVPATEWRYWFSEEELSNANIERIISERPFASLENFNRKKYLHKKIQRYKRMTLSPDSNHFDLDHILPKAVCPLTRLSLFNFVPSCQVCNEKLKKDIELAQTKDDWLKISPTYEKSSFDKDVTFRLVPEVSCSTFFELMKNRENYRIDIETSLTVYENYSSVLRLHDRYNYHRKLALQILDLKERYSEEKIKEISKMMSKQFNGDGNICYTEAQVREDIFHWNINEDDCFSKLRKDMMERN